MAWPVKKVRLQRPTFRKRVALVERRLAVLNEVCLHSGTIPSKTMREAILHLTGYRQRDVCDEPFRHKRLITNQELRLVFEQVTIIDGCK